MIRSRYDPEADVLDVKFGPEGAEYDGAKEVAPGVLVEFDAGGNAIGVEVLSVSLRSAPIKPPPNDWDGGARRLG